MNYIEVTTTGIVTQVKTYKTTLGAKELKQAIEEGEEVPAICELIQCDFIDEDVLHSKVKYLNTDSPERDEQLFVDGYKRIMAAENADLLCELLEQFVKHVEFREDYLVEDAEEEENIYSKAVQLLKRINANS